MPLRRRVTLVYLPCAGEWQLLLSADRINWTLVDGEKRTPSVKRRPATAGSRSDHWICRARCEGEPSSPLRVRARALYASLYWKSCQELRYRRRQLQIESAQCLIFRQMI